MASFKDTSGRTWQVRITVATIRRIKDYAGIDMTGAAAFGEGGALMTLSQDYIALGRALFAVVKNDAEARSVSEDDFLDALAGDTIQAAADAFLEAVADFFPGAQGRLIRAALERAKQEQEKAFAEAEKALLPDAPKAS